jgi:hypothetical protein
LSFARGWPEPETTATGNRSVSPLTELAERLSCSRRIWYTPAAVPLAKVSTGAVDVPLSGPLTAFSAVFAVNVPLFGTSTALQPPRPALTGSDRASSTVMPNSYRASSPVAPGHDRPSSAVMPDLIGHLSPTAQTDFPQASGSPPTGGR